MYEVTKESSKVDYLEDGFGPYTAYIEYEFKIKGVHYAVGTNKRTDESVLLEWAGQWVVKVKGD